MNERQGSDKQQVGHEVGKKNVITRAFHKIRALWESAVEEVREAQNKTEARQNIRATKKSKSRTGHAHSTKWQTNKGDSETKSQQSTESNKVTTTTTTPRQLTDKQEVKEKVPRSSRKRRRDDTEIHKGDDDDSTTTTNNYMGADKIKPSAPAFRRTSLRLEKAKSHSPRTISNKTAADHNNSTSPKRKRANDDDDGGKKRKNTSNTKASTLQQEEDADELTLMTLSPVQFGNLKPEGKK